MSEPKAFKMNNGMDLIGKVTGEDDANYHLEDAVAIIMQQGQVPGQVELGFGPLAPLAERTGRHMGINIPLPKMQVFFPYKPNPDVMNGYTEATSGIAIARGAMPPASNVQPMNAGGSGRPTPIKR